ncbi:glycosyltransferase [Sphingobacterium sp. SRCM116780]|uniref:glycosyltransferase n=1 Tax=Sphingobacterium sp. SRCM116780 TaxID=2907623 RepID=UPI001F2752D9|nr:glycosyltransferase [Sphingobacterium sp. SRCM116780]UIR55909.1 glycosyltransferase [Sphingobacterium sp. SRCM116780]
MLQDRTNMEYHGLSIVILTYNTEVTLLDNCITAIYRNNDIEENLEVIVVDNNSNNQNEVNLYLAQNFPNVQIVNNTINAGYGAGNNLGVEHAKYAYVLLINPDVELIKPVFQWGVTNFIQNSNLKLLGLQQIDQNNKKTHSFLARKLTVNSFLVNFFLQKLNHFNPKYSVINGACFFLRKSSFIQIGGYDPKIFLYGEERYLHEHILKSFPNAEIKMDMSQEYQHPISDRPFSLHIVELGLNSYFYLQQKLGYLHKTTYQSVVKYYKFLILFYTLKNKQKSIADIKLILQLLKSKFFKI